MKPKKLLTAALSLILGTLIYVVALTLVGGDLACTPTSVGAAVGRSDVRAENIKTAAVDIQAEAAKITGEQNTPHVAHITRSAKTIVIDADGIHVDNGEAKKAAEAIASENKAYRENPLVQLAMFVTRWMRVVKWALMIGVPLFLALYVVAFVGGLFNPASAFYRIYETLDGLLPLVNPIRWAHELLDKRTVSVPATVVATPAPATT